MRKGKLNFKNRTFRLFEVMEWCCLLVNNITDLKIFEKLKNVWKWWEKRKNQKKKLKRKNLWRRNNWRGKTFWKGIFLLKRLQKTDFAPKNSYFIKIIGKSLKFLKNIENASNTSDYQNIETFPFVSHWAILWNFLVHFWANMMIGMDCRIILI